MICIIRKYLEGIWYGINKPNIFLFLFLKLLTYVYLLAFYFKKKFSKSYYSKNKIIVVGNITVGGTGKTPFVIYLVDLLRRNNYKVAVISRGFFGSYNTLFSEVFVNSDYLDIGDEPLLIKRKTKVPVFVARDRSFAIKYIEKFCDVDFIIFDDGLQNFGFSYDLSFVMVDGQREFGNNNVLPLGPLREPLMNIKNYDFILFNVLSKKLSLNKENFYMVLSNSGCLVNTVTRQVVDLKFFMNVPINLLAGIGNPKRFFETLSIYSHAEKYIVEDHQKFDLSKIRNSNPIITTEKDALKYDDIRIWFLEVFYKCNDDLNKIILNKLQSI